LEVSSSKVAVTSYDAHVQILPCATHSWQELYGGEIRVTMSVALNIHGSAKPLEFALYRLLDVASVQGETGRSLCFEQSVTTDPFNPRRQINRVRIIPPAGGFGPSVRLRYRGPVCGYAEVWPYVRDHVSLEYTLLRLECLWYPVLLDHLGSIPPGFQYRLEVEVPQPLVAVCAGDLEMGTAARAGQPIYVYQMHRPTWKMTVAAGLFQERKIPGMPIALHTSTVGAANAEAMVSVLEKVAAWATNWLGPLQFEQEALRVVEIPARWGSEAGPGLVLLSRDGFPDEVDASNQWVHGCLLTAGHELLHLWGVPSRETCVSRWLDEGITHYLEAMLLEDFIGAHALTERMEQFRKWFVSAGPAAGRPLAEAGRAEGRDEIARGKGPWVLHVLRQVIGDEEFRSLLGGFLLAFREKGADLTDFAEYVGKRVPVDVTRFFEDWFWGVESSSLLASGMEPERIAARYRS
jgi:hypothetical protein